MTRIEPTALDQITLSGLVSQLPQEASECGPDPLIGAMSNVSRYAPKWTNGVFNPPAAHTTTSDIPVLSLLTMFIGRHVFGMQLSMTEVGNLLTHAMCESALNNEAKHKVASATGLFQFVKTTVQWLRPKVQGQLQKALSNALSNPSCYNALSILAEANRSLGWMQIAMHPALSICYQLKFLQLMGVELDQVWQIRAGSFLPALLKKLQLDLKVTDGSSQVQRLLPPKWYRIVQRQMPSVFTIGATTRDVVRGLEAHTLAQHAVVSERIYDRTIMLAAR